MAGATLAACGDSGGEVFVTRANAITTAPTSTTAPSLDTVTTTAPPLSTVAPATTGPSPATSTAPSTSRPGTSFVLYEFTQANGPPTGWRNVSPLAGTPQVVSNELSTVDGDGIHGAGILHGLDLSGDWQVDFDCDATLIIGDGGVTVYLGDVHGNGWSLFVGNALHIQRYSGGGHTNLTNRGRPYEGFAASEYRVGHATLTHTEAGLLTAYWNGVEWGSATDASISAGAYLVVAMQEEESPTFAATIDNLRVQDYISGPPRLLGDDIGADG